MNSPRYRIFLRTLYGAAINSSLSRSDLKALSEELRRGRLPDELAYMIDRAIEHLGGPSGIEPEHEFVAEAERLIRRRKVSKAALANILSSLGLPPSSSNGNVREMLERFLSQASASRATKLMDILESQQIGDEFLAGISETRK